MKNKTLNQLQKEAIEQFKKGKSLFRNGGVFAPLVQNVVEAALQAEMDEHLSEEERAQGNKRNGQKTKTLRTTDGSFLVHTPQDCHSNFDPQIVKKRQTLIADSMQDQIIALYGSGMSLRDISGHIEQMHGTGVSPTLLAQVTDRVIPELQAWKKRPLNSTYPIVFLDAMHFKVKESGIVQHKALYNVLGISHEGKKEVLGMYVAESEGAKLWLQILTDLQNRGLKDILIACIDNLKGFSEAIEAIFPKTEIQVCVVHQIRNSLRYIASADTKKSFLTSRRCIRHLVKLLQRRL